MVKHAHPLTERQLRELEEELLRERARVERSIGVGAPDAHPAHDSAAAPSPDGWPGSAVDTRTQARHFAVTEALRRLADGTYGICVGCRSPIPYGRLLVMPETAHCVACGARA